MAEDVSKGRRQDVVSALHRLHEDTGALVERVAAGTGVPVEDAAEALENLRAAGEELRVVEEELWRQRDELAAAGEFADARVPSARELLEESPLPVAVTTPAGLVLMANTALARVLGRGVGDVVGRPLAAFAGPPTGAVRRLAARAGRSTSPVTESVHLLPRNRLALRLRATVRSVRSSTSQEPVLLWMLHPAPWAEAVPSLTPAPARSRAAVDGGHSREADDAEDGDLLAPLVGLASLLLVEEGLRPGLQRVAEAALAAVPAASGMSVTLLEPPSVAATGDAVRLADQLQYEREDGPCVDAMRLRRTVVSGDLAEDRRWPGTGPLLTRDTGFRCVAAVPLLLREEVLGVLNAYAGTPDALGPSAVGVLESFAAPAEAALRNARAYEEAQVALESMRSAMLTRGGIERAKGALMARYRLQEDQAFSVLRRRSQALNVPVEAVAQQVVDDIAGGRDPELG